MIDSGVSIIGFDEAITLADAESSYLAGGHFHFPFPLKLQAQLPVIAPSNSSVATRPP
jgi:hypothetical protein